MNALAVFRAISEQIQKWETLSDSVQGVYLSLADRNSTFPYLVVDVLSGTTLETFKGRLTIEDLLIRISVYSQSENVEQVARITEYLHDCFDNAKMVFVEGDYTGMGCRRLNMYVIREREDVWHTVTDYSVMFETSAMRS